MLKVVSNFGLNIATLGIEKFKNSLYADIAFGFREDPSLRLYSVIFGLLPIFILGAMTGVFSAQKRLNSSKGGTQNPEVNRTLKVLGRPVLILVVFLLVFSAVQANQVAYENRAITHFNQLLAIASPYLREDERIMFRSRFAQISSKDDYAKLVEALTAICRAQKLKTPEFSIW